MTVRGFKFYLVLCFIFAFFVSLMAGILYWVNQKKHKSFTPIINGVHVTRQTFPKYSSPLPGTEGIHFTAKVTGFSGAKPQWWGQSNTRIEFREIVILNEDGRKYTFKGYKDYRGWGGYFMPDEKYYYESATKYLPIVKKSITNGQFQADLVFVNVTSGKVLYSTRVLSYF